MALLLAAMALATPVRAATIIVNTNADELNTDGDCALREAIEAANTNAAVDACLGGQASPIVDVITVPAATYLLDLALSDLLVTESVAIVGANRATTIIDGNADDRVFNLGSGDVTISNLTITNGLPEDDNGGGIYVDSATLNLINTAVSDNHVTDSGAGGGIYVDDGSSAVITGSLVSANTSAEDDGGGIYLDEATLTLSGSAVSGNSAGEDGGGIYVDGESTATLINSVVSGNMAVEIDGEGGGIYTEGALSLLNTTVHDNDAEYGGGINLADPDSATLPTILIDRSTISLNTATGVKGGGDGGGIFSRIPLSLLNSTISGNSATNRGGGVWVSADMTIDFSTIASNTSLRAGGIWVSVDEVDLFATIVANNTGTGPEDDGNCFADDGSINSLGSNLDSDDTCDLDPLLSDKPATNPLLGVLANNGGPTMTHALLAGSPAIDAVVTSVTNLCVATDQRAIPRPQDGDNNGTLACDIGAFELAGLLPDAAMAESESPGFGLLALVILALGGVAAVVLGLRRRVA